MWWILLAAAVALQALVMGLLWLAFARPRIGTGLSERNFVIAGGLLLPGVLLTPLLVYALLVGEKLLPHPEQGVPQIRINAEQFAWTFLYRDGDESRISHNLMHLPVRRPVDVHVTSSDVIHSFWIPRLAGKIDAIPGHTTVVRVQADQPGLYQGQCAEFCGVGHAFMHFIAQAHEEEDYRAAIGGLPSAAEPTSPPAAGNGG
jgi:cytochrome c oxidase subunit II